MEDRWNAFVPYGTAPVRHAETGSLSGLRLAVKDLFDVQGYPTSAGNPLILAASGVKTKTAPLVRQLLDAGACFVGKTNTDELAYSLIGGNIHFGMPLNPAYPDLIPGGSSSGSAVAVAAGLADIGLGTDTSGSVRLPAAANGLFGWRPTHGLLSKEGLRPLAPSFDVPGFLSNSLEVMEKIMDAVDAPPVVSSPSSLIVPEDVLAHCDPEIIEHFLSTLQANGARFETIPSVASMPLDALRNAFTIILQKEAWESNASLFHTGAQSIAPDIRERLVGGSRLSAQDVSAARRLQAAFGEEINRHLGCGKILVMPTLPVYPPRRTAHAATYSEFRARCMALLCLSGLSGCPQLSRPLASRGDYPRSVSLLAGKFQDRALLHAAGVVRAVF